MRPLAGSKVLVVGMARSGQSAARLALAQGARVTCTDLRPDAPRVPGTEAVHGAHRRADFLDADLVVVSPGVPASQPDVAAAIAAGRAVVGELAFAAMHLDVPLLAVTGTNGKSTTTHLLGQVLAAAGRRPFVGGNLGRPLSEAVGTDCDIVAVEVSSYQMELPGTFHPRAAAILNLTPDHLERHGTMEAYGAHKCRVFARMGPGDAAIIADGDPLLRRLADAQPGTRWFLGGTPGVEVLPHALRFTAWDAAGGPSAHEPRTRDLHLHGFRLPGVHNRENLAAAALLAWTGAGVDPAGLDTAALTGLPHRMEPVGDHGGVRWINDSKATNVDSTLVALASVELPRTWVLLGGQAKAASPWTLLATPLRHAAGVVCFGASGPAIAEALRAEGIDAHTVPGMEDAVRLCAHRARPGESVLLSPACASFDAFRDFEHRGDSFRTLLSERTA
jgi:UDP-N-acetylmuramoylalanine--D-glutamate ligase